MNKTHQYGLTDYADDGTLRISSMLWLVLIYLSRYVVIIALGAVSSFISSRRGLDLSGLAMLYSSPDFLLASLPALLIIAANMRRVPRAHKSVRLIWRHGRGLLICSVLLDLCLLFIHRPERLHQVSLLYVFGALIDLYLLVYLYSANRVRDTFADFPAAPVAANDEDA
jgi:hypothetical protein|tara:strand:+ start:1338 stop:1844 length:507 start_codon:yes stop_codon:yes gene_type:complete